MVWRTEFAADAEQDFALFFDQLFAAHEGFGVADADAFDRAVLWFDLDEPSETVRILAIFFGRQDHVRHMLVRLLDRPDRD